MRSRLRAMWQWIRNRRRLRRETSPDSFRHAAAEMLELIGMARRLWPGDSQFQARLQRIEREMHQLHSLTEQRQFRHLSLQKRLELRDSLQRSRQMLIHSLETVPPPTDRVQ